MLAKDEQKAQEWLKEGRWFPDRTVRQYIHEIVMPGVPEDESPYRQYYREASDLVHPTAWSTFWMAWHAGDNTCRPRLIPEFNEDQLNGVLREIEAEAAFVCFAIVRGIADEGALPVEWRRELKHLAEEIAAEGDWSHLERDWERETEQFQSIIDHILPAPELDAFLEQHPNSMRNIRRRMSEEEPQTPRWLRHDDRGRGERETSARIAGPDVAPTSF